LFLLKTFKALNGLLYADVLLRNYSLTQCSVTVSMCAIFSVCDINWFLWEKMNCCLLCIVCYSFRSTESECQ